MMRLARYIALSGHCSRRAASRLIESGVVQVNGRQARHTDRVGVEDHVSIEGRPLKPAAQQTYLIYNKPVGIDCVCLEHDEQSIVHQIASQQRVFPVGRLDKDSHGLMLLTSDGDLCQRILHPNYYHEKVYRVRVDRGINDDFCTRMAQGVEYGSITTKPCRVERQGTDVFQITLTQGLNRQIHKMCRSLGYRVMDLQRTQLVNLTLGSLPFNQYRELTGSEEAVLKATLDGVN